MRTWVLAFLLGDASLLFFSSLPSIIWAWLLFVISIVFFLLYIFVGATGRSPLQKLLFGFALGFSWSLLHASNQLALQLPTELESKTLTAIGTVATIPELHGKNVSFEFIAQQLQDNNFVFSKPIRIRLSWYSSYNHDNLHPVFGHLLPEGEGKMKTADLDKQLQQESHFLNNNTLRVGDTWQLTVRLKRPRSFWNPGSYDYQKWLFEHHIRATGYVVPNAENIFLSSHNFSIDRLRTYLASGVTQSLNGKPLVGLINALTVGVRSEITEEQWQVMRGTGTNHLFAIAGLHIGFVSGMIYALVSFCWRRVGQLSLYIPASQAAAFSALLIAMFYSALAGFSLPTQRAVIMTAVFLLATLLRKQLPAWTAWSLALLLVLLIEPLAFLSDSFWLSFGAVAYIIYGISARLHHGHWLKHWSRIQWVVAVGLIPLTLLFFHQTSLAGFIANAFAIPWVGFVVMPLCMLGSLIWLLLPSVGSYLILFSERAMELIWPVLTYISKLDQAQWYAYISNGWILFVASIAMILLLAPRGFPARWLGLIWLLPLLIWKPAQPKYGEIWFTLLDVGQGLATVVRTQQHVLVYDTGPKFSENFDTGNAVVLPFLNYSGIKTVDMLMISHPDNDHIGGTYSLLKQLPVKQILTSAPEKFKTASYCVAGQQWQWDGVNFKVLYPPASLQGFDNDSSCVLHIDNGKQSILLVGDIEKASEQYLVANAVGLLPSTILVVPHHGSKTSSTIEFINAVHPQYALFAVGYRNRFGFPKIEIISRYQQQEIKTFTTVNEGAMTFKLTEEKLLLETYRDHYLRFWH